LNVKRNTLNQLHLITNQNQQNKMGFFDKVKKFVGKTGVKLEYKWIENPFAFGDPMIKATINVKAEDGDVTVTGLHGKFVAKRTNADGEEEEILLGEEIQEPNENHTTTRNGESVPVYPCKISAGSEESFGYFIGMHDEMNLAESLAEWGVDSPEAAKIKGVKFYFIGEVDIKETNFLFDPSLEEEITVK